jgi:hypothetical protein
MSPGGEFARSRAPSFEESGKREEMIGILLRKSAVDMPGCFGYLVAKHSAEENAIWVTAGVG